jgi:hypothetical protein
VEEDLDIGIRPEQYLRGISETEFLRRHQCSPRTLAAFENSEHPDDWRELMRLYLVRRTRSFIQENYARTDESNNRRYLEFPDGKRSYFPTRTPRTIRFEVNDQDPDDQYARLYSEQVVDTINDLALPRYGLGNYIAPNPEHTTTTRGLELSGSSPRLWGTLGNGQGEQRILRFIPTPVGNIIMRAVKEPNIPVHPHACGEHFMQSHKRLSTYGSSPRLWGTFDSILFPRENARFIPTPVGNIAGGECFCGAWPVHPHACGEHIIR